VGPQLSGGKKRISCSAICVPCDSASGLLDHDQFCADVNTCPLILFYFVIPLHRFSTLGDFRTKMKLWFSQSSSAAMTTSTTTTMIGIVHK
jgi:hypothetical protein